MPSNLVFALAGFMLLAVVNAAWSFAAPNSPDATFIAWVLVSVIATLGLLLLAKLTEPRPTNWLTIDILFAFTYIIVQYGYFFYWTTGLLEGEVALWNIGRAHAGTVVNKTLAMYATTLNLFLFGYHWKPLRLARPTTSQIALPPSLVRGWSVLGNVLLLAGAGGFVGYAILVGPAEVFGSYSGTNNKGFLPNISFLLGQIFIAAGIATLGALNYQHTGGRRTLLSWLGMKNNIIIAAVLFGLALHGDRSTLMWVFLALLITYSEYVKPISIKWLSVLCLGFLFLMGAIVVFRSTREVTSDLGFVASVNRSILNFGGSSVCGMVAVDYTEQRGYFNGKMQVLQMAGLIPFGRKIFGMEEGVEESSSMLLTLLINGYVGRKMVGTGSSVFADLYFDFGFIITSLIFLLTGYLSKYAFNKSRGATSLLWIVLIVTLTMYMAQVSRYTLTGGIIRLVLYPVGFTFIFATILRVPLSMVGYISRSAPMMTPNVLARRARS